MTIDSNNSYNNNITNIRNITNNIKNIINSNTINLINIRSMSIYDYLRQHFNPVASKKRQRRYIVGDNDELLLPSPKVRKQHQQHHQWNHWERHEERGKKHGTNSTMDNYDIRFFFYINSLILFTMSCRQYEGDEFKHFIVHHIKEFDRLRRKARKRRKRRMRATKTTATTAATTTTVAAIATATNASPAKLQL
ncbi:hypothetical protein ACLKA7_001676 [Drosophila subpalustris]